MVKVIVDAAKIATLAQNLFALCCHFFVNYCKGWIFRSYSDYGNYSSYSNYGSYRDYSCHRKSKVKPFFSPFCVINEKKVVILRHPK